MSYARFTSTKNRTCALAVTLFASVLSISNVQAQTLLVGEVVPAGEAVFASSIFLLASHHTEGTCGNGPCGQPHDHGAAPDIEKSPGDKCADGRCGEVEPAEPSTVLERKKKPADD